MKKDLYPGKSWKISRSRLPPAATGQSMRRNRSWTQGFRTAPGSTWYSTGGAQRSDYYNPEVPERRNYDETADCWGSISKEAAEFLEKLVKAKYNMFISGGTGSGKTTFLNALSQFIPEDERIITIEDNAELKFSLYPIS